MAGTDLRRPIRAIVPLPPGGPVGQLPLQDAVHAQIVQLHWHGDGGVRIRLSVSSHNAILILLVTHSAEINGPLMIFWILWLERDYEFWGQDDLFQMSHVIGFYIKHG